MSKILIGRDYPPFAIDLIKNAKCSIKILMFDWRWYSHHPGARIQQFNNELVRARKRNIEIKCAVNSNFIFPFLREQDIKIKKVDFKRTMHIKLIIVDSQKCLVGSHNLTMNAFEVNHEMSVYLDDQENISKCEAFFDRLYL